MPNLGFPEILVILVVALLVFGPRKLPELGKSLGAGLREFRRSTQGLKEEFEGVMHEPEVKPAQPAGVQVISAQPQVVMAQSAAVPATQAAQPQPNPVQTTPAQPKPMQPDLVQTNPVQQD